MEIDNKIVILRWCYDHASKQIVAVSFLFPYIRRGPRHFPMLVGALNHESS